MGCRSVNACNGSLSAPTVGAFATDAFRTHADRWYMQTVPANRHGNLTLA